MRKRESLARRPVQGKTRLKSDAPKDKNPARTSSSKLRPNFTGVWELNLEKSTLRGPAPERIQVNIQHQEPKLVQQILITYSNGSLLRLRCVFRMGDVSANLIGGRAMRTQAHWEGDELLLESTLEASGAALHYKDYWSLSRDGKTLTMEHRDDDLAGQVSILEKLPDTQADFQEEWGRS